MRASEALDVLLHPMCWVQTCGFSATWDRELTRLLDRCEPPRAVFFDEDGMVPNNYEIQIGPYHVWIANHPYGSFTVEQGGRKYRPRRATILRAGRLLRLENDAPDFVPVGEGL